MGPRQMPWRTSADLATDAPQCTTLQVLACIHTRTTDSPVRAHTYHVLKNLLPHMTWLSGIIASTSQCLA
jgi:hypothetical protein